MKRILFGKWIITLGVVIVFCAVSASAQAEFLDDSNFEIDTDIDGADLIADDGGDDWDSFAHADIDIDPEKRRVDLASGSSDNAFGQGSKEDTPVPSIVTGSIPPNKSDLKTFGVYLEEVPAVGDDERKLYLHLFWHRVQDPSGSTNMDFEFNQGKVISANNVTPVRTAGDILIQYDLAGGGTVPELFLSYWLDGSEVPPASGGDCEASNQLPCWGARIPLSDDNVAIGSINTSFIPAFPDDETDGLDDVNGLDPRTFGEATINFEALVPTSGAGCLSFGSAYLKSRSSDSFNSSLKDFIAPIEVDVDNCAQLTIIKQDETGPGTRIDGAVFEVWANNVDGGINDAPDFDEDGKLNPDPSPQPDDPLRVPNYECVTGAVDDPGECVFTNVLPGQYWVIEIDPPTGYDPASPDYQLKTITPGGGDVTATFINYQQPASVTINKTDDADVALAGATFTLYTDNAPVGTFNADGATPDVALVIDSATKSCTTGADGTCTISGILPPGDYCLDESTTPTGYDKADPQCFNLSLGEDLTIADDELDTFVNDRQPASVTINKTDDDTPPNVLQGAQFTLYSSADLTLDGGDTVFGSCTTDVTGSCTIPNVLPPGNYCLDETLVPTGYTKDSSFPQCFALALNQSKTVSSVNPRQPASVTINKTDDDTPPNVLQGAQFTLYSSADLTLDGGDTVFGSCTTDVTGSCTITNILPPGNYCLDETQVPSGHTKDSNFPQCFALALNQSKTVNSVNPRQRGAIKVTKTRKHKVAANPSSDPHMGVTFTVTDRDGTVIGSGATNASGVYCLDNILLSQYAPGDGAYVVTETVPTGYSVDQDNPQTVTVDQVGSCGNNEETLLFGNTPLTDFTISINSQIPGGTQTVISCDNDAGGKTILAASPDNGDGSHTATNLSPGTYNCTITIDP